MCVREKANKENLRHVVALRMGKFGAQNHADYLLLSVNRRGHPDVSCPRLCARVKVCDKFGRIYKTKKHFVLGTTTEAGCEH